MIRNSQDTGFTLIEVIIAISVLAIVFAMTVSVYFALRPQSQLDADARKIESALRFARSRALSSEGAVTYGVHAEAERVVLFSGVAYAPGSVANEIVELSSNTLLYGISLAGGGQDVLFERVTGATAQNGTLSLRAKSDPAQTRTIYIEVSGNVNRQGAGGVGVAGLKTDARHTHFVLGWSMQNAATLEFYFPNANQTEQVDMAQFFSVDATEFSWIGTFLVGGTSQTFRVHTHLLNATNTTLSVHRDRNGGSNNQKVQVRIIDGGITKNIATYLADAADTVQLGGYGGSMSIQ